MSDLQEFAEKVLAAFSKKLTDEVFLLIQNDKALMREYSKLVEGRGLRVVNQQIGRHIKKRYSLTKPKTRATKPRSTLIQTHGKF